jgi:cytochrome c oxidase assembly factor CtaG
VRADLQPLTWAAAASSWHPDITSAVAIVLLGLGYWWCAARAGRGGHQVQSGRAWCFGIGLAVWALATLSAIGVYAYALFWVRALQVVLLLFVVPFLIACGKPLTVVRDALSPPRREVFDRLLATPAARLLAHPLTTSVAMLGTPWLLYLTPWYAAALQTEWIGAPTRILLVLIGFGYFYARIQADPVPRRYSQLVSLLISVGETIGDGVLGLVIWQGSLIAEAYYVGLHRLWGPNQRLDQTIGAGILWILGDVLGIPFVLVLMRALSTDERRHATEVDAELDKIERAGPETPEPAPQSTLWWENDPQLRERFRRG